ncbi:MAG: hypothetical protein Q4A42_02175 [Tissierellia bacterium]|nr:hypothetical protein [Tissierellia bacterium]
MPKIAEDIKIAKDIIECIKKCQNSLDEIFKKYITKQDENETKILNKIDIELKNFGFEVFCKDDISHSNNEPLLNEDFKKTYGLYFL